MERTDIIKSVYDLKCEVLKEIRKVLPNGIHYYTQPFFIHYVEGEVANTEICKAVEVAADECQMVKIHHQSEGYGENDIDITDGEEIMNYEPNSFADILGNLKAEIRGEKLSVLRNLVEQNGGKMDFDGNFRYVGYDPEVCIDDCEDTLLMGFDIDNEGKLIVDNIWQGDEYSNTENYLTDAELDRIIEYVRNYPNVDKELRKQIRTEVMRTFADWLTASDIESMAESIIDDCVEDVKVCSDYPHYNDSDVRIAIQRVILNRVIGE